LGQAAEGPAPDSERILAELERFGIKLGLETTRELLAKLGNPQCNYPVVLVSGTNGKGSTAALIDSMIRAAGYRCGLFVSPHLESPLERLSFNGGLISDAALAALLERTVDVGRSHLGHSPSYFEALCVAALDWFDRNNAEVAVLEVGLGGRLDATNVCDPVLSIVTSVGLDHQQQLGETLAEIASEKAGILRSGRPVLTACGGVALEVIRSHAVQLGAPLEVVDPDDVNVVEEGLRGQVLEIRAPAGPYRLSVELAGEHQRENIQLAVRACEILADQGFDQLGRSAVEAGASTCRWPGRCELVELPTGGSVLLDVAHNTDGARVLARFLSRHYSSYVLVFGALEGKNSTGMVEALTADAVHVVLTRPPSTRARAPVELKSVLHRAEGLAVELAVVESPSRALDYALDQAASWNGRTVVCGSLYLVGELRRVLSERFGVPTSATVSTSD